MRQLLLRICLICCLSSFSQNFYPPVVNYSIKDYGKDRNPENYCAIQDHRGVMYFGNSHGVLEFDGESWNFVQVGYGSFVRSLAVDSNGVIYAGAYGDFGFLSPDNTGQLTFHSLIDQLPEEDQFFGNVWRIHSTSTTVYFQSEEALFVYDTESGELKTIYPDDSFHTSFLLGTDLYLRERQKGIVRLEGDELNVLGGTEIFADYGVFGVHELEDDSLLIITQELGIYKWHNGAIRQLPDPNETPLETLGIFGSILLSDGNLALNTFTNGLIIVDQKGAINRRIDRVTGIRSDVVQHVFQDRDLNLWLSLGNGISKVNYHSPLSYFDEKAGVEGNVDAITRFKGQIFVGTSYGLFVQDLTIYGARKFRNTEVIKEQVWDFCEVNGTLYIGAGSGIYKTTDGISFDQVNYQNTNIILYRNWDKVFITGGAHGIVIYDSNFNELWAYRDNFPTFLGGAINPSNENEIWLGTTKAGVYRIVGLDTTAGFKIDAYGMEAGLLDDLGKPMIYEDSLIFGAKDGLFSFINEDQMKIELQDQLTEEELEDPAFYMGIFDHYVLKDSVFNGQFLLLEKGKDRTWYCNEFKIGYYDHNTGEFRNRPFWGIDYGRINEFYLEDDGVLWIGAAEGLIRYEKNDLKLYESQFYSLIRKVNLSKGETLFNGVYVDDSGQFTMAQNPNKIPEIIYKQNDVEFSFSAPYFEDEHQPEYRFILEGLDENWSDWKVKSEANYNNLHEGEYAFKVEARNVYGQISEQAVYRFVILPPWYRTSWAYILYVIAFGLVLFAGVKISSKRLKAKNQWLEGIVEERTKEISQKNIVLEHQKQEIEDSINYAQRIQQAILPLEDEMKKWIPDSFVLFRPKDIVSGDFYWFLERDGKLVFICADCTGHGVPGAFMSMIGSDRLNNIVSENKITSPALILSELNRAIKKSLKQDGQKDSTKDGMDAAICTVDLVNKKLYYAGANRPLWILNKGEFQEIKATKVAVAGFTPDDQVYEEHEIELTEDLKFYMTTDGYADQFGGTRNKKYKVKNMKAFIIENAGKSFAEQRELLEKELLAWMGDFEQVDDVCVIGFQI